MSIVLRIQIDEDGAIGGEWAGALQALIGMLLSVKPPCSAPAHRGAACRGAAPKGGRGARLAWRAVCCSAAMIGLRSSSRPA